VRQLLTESCDSSLLNRLLCLCAFVLRIEIMPLRTTTVSPSRASHRSTRPPPRFPTQVTFTLTTANSSERRSSSATLRDTQHTRTHARPVQTVN
jgi:hypothetical protein